MTFKSLLFLVFTVAPSAHAQGLNACDSLDYKPAKEGWVRTSGKESVQFIEFRTTRSELDLAGMDVRTSIPAWTYVARNAAVREIYQQFKALRPPPMANADLAYEGMESASKTCWGVDYIAYRVSLEKLRWVAPSADDEMLPAVREFLRKKQLIN